MTAVNLPQEILCKIFSYLSLSDKLQCNLTCTQWHWAFLDSALHDDTVISFDDNDELLRKSLINDGEGLLDSLITSAVRSLHFKKLSLDIFSVRPIIDWSTYLTELKCLVLSDASVVNETELVLLLKHCVSLTSLTLNNARDVFISGGFLSSEDDQRDVRESLKNVFELDLSWNSPYLTDRLFNRIVSCTQNVTDFILRNTKILNHSGIYKKYYPESKGFNSPSVLTWRNILRFISERQEILTKMDFYASNVSSEGLFDLNKVPKLRLKSVNLGKCTDISQEALLQFCQPTLEELNIDECRKVLVDHPEKCLQLFEKMSQLKNLSMRCISAPKGMENCFQQLDKIEQLDLSHCDIPSKHVAVGLSGDKNVGEKIEKLVLNSFGMHSDELSLFTPCLVNLTHLELRNGHEGVTDSALISITMSCSQLQVLILNDCSRLTDLGFMGIDSVGGQNLPNISDGNKIFLGSKGEAEVRNEIKRLEYLSELANTPSGDFGIQKLKRLQRLEIQNVRITQAALFRFQFDDLRMINLNLCKLIDNEGFCRLAEQNPHLEHFSAKQCALNGETLVNLAKNCPRLQIIDIEACPNVTDNSIKELCNFSPNLRTLDLSFCRGVRVSTIEKLLFRQIPTLRGVGMRGLAVYEAIADFEEDSINFIQNPPPPPPFPKH